MTAIDIFSALLEDQHRFADGQSDRQAQELSNSELEISNENRWVCLADIRRGIQTLVVNGSCLEKLELLTVIIYSKNIASNHM